MQIYFILLQNHLGYKGLISFLSIESVIMRPMADILLTAFSNTFSLMKIFQFLFIHISLKFAAKDLSNDNSVLIQMMALPPTAY